MKLETLEDKHFKVLCYPNVDRIEAEERVKQLHRLGIRQLYFKGKQKIDTLKILGKGCVGIVVCARMDSEDVALKIRRTDANRTAMDREARMLEIANSSGIGPKLLSFSKNFLVMEYIDGNLIEDWIDNQREKLINEVLRGILMQCYNLDIIGLDHGELSQARKHIMIGEENQPRILDFETASITRKVRNVSSICQYLFISSKLSKKLEDLFGKIDINKLKTVVTCYKHNINLQSFEEVLKWLDLYSNLN